MFKEGDAVIIRSPNFFHGFELAAYLHPCKTHDGGYECWLLDKENRNKLVFVNPNNKDEFIQAVQSYVTPKL